MELNKYIKELLITKDNVIIQDFGAFEKVVVSASIDEKSGEMTPPHTNIIFKPELKTDSGVLVKYISEKENLTEEQVAEEIKKHVDTWNQNLAGGKNVVIPGIGMIHKNESGVVEFQSNVSPEEFPDSYGLSSIKIQEKSALAKQNVDNNKNKNNKKTPIKKKPEKKPVQKKTKPTKTVKPKVVKEKTTTGSKSNKKLIVGLSVGIPLVAMIVLGILFYDTIGTYVSDLLGNDDQKDTTTAQVINIDTITEKDSTNQQTEAILENYTIISSDNNTKLEPKVEALSSAKKFHLIAGSFKSSQFAKRHRNKLNRKGYQSTVLPPNNGLFRVALSSFDDVESASKAIEKIKASDESLNIWILVDN